MITANEITVRDMDGPQPLVLSPGVYEGLSFADYCRIRAINNGFLADMHEYSPMHADYYRRHPEPGTDALLVGRAMHTMILEPGKFGDEFAIVPEGTERKSNAGKAAWAEFCSKNEGKDVLTADQQMLAEAMAESIRRCPAAWGLIQSEGGSNEVTLVWRDPVSGVTLKARCDMIRPLWAAIGDLKTTISAAPESFSKSIATFGYHRQAALYLAGAKALGLPLQHFGIVAVEKTPPFAVATYAIDAAALDAGREQIRRLLAIVAQCQETGTWYGYEEQFPYISVPTWEIRKAFNPQL